MADHLNNAISMRKLWLWSLPGFAPGMDGLLLPPTILVTHPGFPHAPLLDGILGQERWHGTRVALLVQSHHHQIRRRDMPNLSRHEILRLDAHPYFHGGLSHVVDRRFQRHDV